MTNKTYQDPMDAIRSAEINANEYRRELLDMATENDQLWHNYTELFDTVTSVNNRIKSVEFWGSEPEITLNEIKEMLSEVVE